MAAVQAKMKSIGLQTDTSLVFSIDAEFAGCISCLLALDSYKNAHDVPVASALLIVRLAVHRKNSSCILGTPLFNQVFIE
jgi:hypothetical protein